MIVKKGKLGQSLDHGDFQTNIEVTVIEKTEGNYTEVLFRKDKDETITNGVPTMGNYETVFKVYANTTIDDVLSLENVSNIPWVETLTQIS